MNARAPAERVEVDEAARVADDEAKRWMRVRCRACGHGLADPDDEAPAPDGRAGGAFVNPGGYVHEIRLFAAAPGALEVGPWVAEHSWFAGTAWRLLLCGGCGGHVGWAWRAETGAGAPFVGLRLVAIVEAP